MSAIEIKSSGSFKNTERWLSKLSKNEIFDALDAAGRRGVQALSAATPFNTGMTSESWT